MALLLFWKRQGLTSHAALAELSKIIGHKRKGGKSGIGHTGTLDPFAEGLLLVGVGEGTKLLSAFTGQDKSYEAVFDFAHSSDTFDTESNPTENFGATEFLELSKVWNQEKISLFLKSKIGFFDQVPPQTSAVHVDGKRAYEWARAGITKELKARPARIHSIEVLSWKWPELRVVVKVSSGTYIRSLARDWGLELFGKSGRLTRLIRQSIGPWAAEAAEFSPEKPHKYLSLNDLQMEFDSKALEPYELKGLENGSWNGNTLKKALLIAPDGQIKAWVDLIGNTAKLQRLFLTDPLKNLE